MKADNVRSNISIVCPCHKKLMKQMSDDSFYCKISGYWEVSELVYLYGNDWKTKLSLGHQSGS